MMHRRNTNGRFHDLNVKSIYRRSDASSVGYATIYFDVI